MSFFKKIFGKKKKDESLSEMLDDAGLDLEVGFGDEPENLNEEDIFNYCLDNFCLYMYLAFSFISYAAENILLF